MFFKKGRIKIISIIILVSILMTSTPALALVNFNVKSEESSNNLDSVNSVLEEFSEYYSSKKICNYLDTLIIRRMGYEVEDLELKVDLPDLPFKIDKNKSIKTSAEYYAKSIMAIISMGKDPRNYKGRDYVSFLVESQTSDGNFKTNTNNPNVSDLSYSIIALDMAGAVYNRQAAINLLKSYYTVEKNTAYVKKMSFFTNGDYEYTALATLALSKESDLKSKEIKDKVNNFYKGETFENGLLGDTNIAGEEIYHIKESALMIQALVAIEGDINPKTISNLLEVQSGENFIDDSIKEINEKIVTSEVLAALTDVNFKNSMFNEIRIDTGEANDFKIILYKPINKNKIKHKYEAFIDVFAIDKDGLVVENSNKYQYKIENKEVLNFDKNEGLIFAKNPGKSKITFSLDSVNKGLEIEVINKEAESINLSVENNLSELIKGKKYSLNIDIRDKDNDLIIDPDYSIEFEPEGFIEYDKENQLLYPKKAGEVKVKVFKDDKYETLMLNILDFDKKLEQTIKEIDQAIEKETDKYDYLISLAFSSLGKDRNIIASNAKVNGKYFPTNIGGYSENIITALAVGMDPKNFHKNNQVLKLKEKLDTDKDRILNDKKNIDHLIKAIIALDMANEDYKQEEILNDLIGIMESKGNRKYFEYSNGNADIESTALMLIALSNYQHKNKYKKVKDEIINYLKLKQDSNGLIGNAEEHSLVILGLMSVEEDIYSDKWVKDSINGRLNLIESLLKLKVGEGEFKLNTESLYSKDTVKYKVLAALVDAYNGFSMFKNKDIIKEDSYKIEIKNTNLDILQGEKIKLTVDTFKNGVIEDIDTIWELEDETIASINENGELKALKPGKTKVFARIKGFENIYDFIEITVLENKSQPEKILLNFDYKNPLIKNSETEITYSVLDKYGNELEIEVDWESMNKDVAKIVSKNKIKALKPGSAKILGKVKDENLNIEFVVTILESDKELEYTINSYIKKVENYYNTTYYRENNGQLTALDIVSLKKADIDIDKKWYLEKDYFVSYDKDLKYLGSKAYQVISMLSQDRDPTAYKNRNLIEEIITELNQEKHIANQTYLRGVIAVNEYNEKYVNNTIEYDKDIVLDNIKKTQLKDGGFPERNNGKATVINTSMALSALKVFNGEDVNKVKENAINFINKNQKEKGRIYIESFSTNIHANVLIGLIDAGEDLTSKKWTTDGINAVDALFSNWDPLRNRFNNTNNDSPNNMSWKESTREALYTLGKLRNINLGNYVVKFEDLKDKEIEPEIPEKQKEVEVYTAIIKLNSNGEYEILNSPKKTIINSKKHKEGLNVLGALEATTSLYEKEGTMVSSIYGIKNTFTGGWMYTVNNVRESLAANQKEVKNGDKVLWYYDLNGMDGKVPKWEEVFKEKEDEQPNISDDSENNDINNNENNNENNNTDDSEDSKEDENSKEDIKSKFKDLVRCDWALESIYKLTENNIIKGRTEDTFEPHENITRAEFSILISRILKLENNKVDKKFKDVKYENWYGDEIYRVYNAGYIKGYEDNTFKPDNPITREEIATIIGRILKEKDLSIEIKKDVEFKDFNEISDWALESMKLVISNKLIKGYEDNTIKPKSNATRAETVVILDRLIDMLK